MRLRRGSVAALLGCTLIAGCGSTVQLNTTNGTATDTTDGLGVSNGVPDPSSTVGPGEQPTDTSGPSTITGDPTSAPTDTPTTPGEISGPSSPTGGPTSSMPTSGPGWDAKNVYVGVTVQSDATAMSKATGIKSIDYGDQIGILKAVVKWVNSKGGMLGRTIVPSIYDVKSTGNAIDMASAACAQWTQDRRVISATLVQFISNDNSFGCLSKAKVPTFTGGTSLQTRASLAKYPYLRTDFASQERFGPTYIDTLNSMGYFSAWNTSKGAPGSAPVKVGLLYQDNAIQSGAWQLFKKQLEDKGIKVADIATYSGAQDVSQFVLKFRSDGVTHVFFDGPASFYWPSVAQSQQYYARYGVTSTNVIHPFLDNGSHKRQLAGLAGVGWQPQQDVPPGREPARTAEQTACLNAVKQAGEEVNEQNPRYLALGFCDLFLRLQAGSKIAGTFAADSLISGMGAATKSFRSAATFAIGDFDDQTSLAAVRPLKWDDSCVCVLYSGGNVRLP